jgi:hypothetical protein
MMFIIHRSDKCGLGRKGSQAGHGFFTMAGQNAGFWQRNRVAPKA